MRDKPMIDMVMVEGGSFMMGCNSGDPEEYPAHEVSVAPFLMGKTPVTQEEYESITGLTPSRFAGGNLPVEQVTWLDAIRFCNLLSRSEGLECVYSGNLHTVAKADPTKTGYRLPSEAEWEYAARGGKKSAGYEFAGSRLLETVGWYRFNASQTMPVAQMAPNELGLYDMSGNVWEWCFDAWQSYGLPADRVIVDVYGEGLIRIHRGGSWWSSLPMCRVTHRSGHYCTHSRSDVGFRVARSCA